MWKKLLKLRPLARQLSRKVINSGSGTSFWFDCWSQAGRLIELTGERWPMDLGIPINSSVESAIQLYRAKRHRAPVLQLIDKEVMRLRNKGLNNQEDLSLWRRENGDFKEDFSTAQTWNTIRTQAPKVPWFKGVWFSGATPRLSFMVWIAIHDRLATDDRISRWNPQAIVHCWLCQGHFENRDHLFFECGYSKEVWCELVKNLAGSRRIYEWLSVTREVVRGLRGKMETFLYRYCFQLAVSAIWRERNVRRVGESMLRQQLVSQPAWIGW
ncbi:unnamed protein product [Brassica rapa]|uniref:Reverse transcriptase zinc-binding domain-containing protein n=1 Tax=Brassica campestris TaxID=3711 RepID=A0A3P6BQL3_BRACM|nr:unnamed protein product [Brassica rapa]VDD03294.1 unnamed protein product [Brassica rapa]